MHAVKNLSLLQAMDDKVVISQLFANLLVWQGLGLFY
jgi:hypothetical protein